MPKRKAATPPKTDVQMIPLNRLKKSPRNARTVPHTKEEIAALAASHKAHGLLQNPVVEPELDRAGKPTGKFLVTAGEGRRQALLLRAKRGEIPKSFAVRCVVDTEHDAYELSLAENTIRTPMHPADQFDAFYDLHIRKGLPAEDIAARFGVTAAVVRQRLKLAAVSPVLMAAYRGGAMTLDQLSAFTVTDDIALQERVWEEAGPRSSRPDIVAALTDTQIAASDPRAAFVGTDAYRAAGGAIVQDLFDAESGGYYADPELLFRLAREKLAAVGETLKAEGWKWIEIMPRFDHGAVADCRRVYPARRTLSEAEQERLEGLEAEYEALAYDGSDDSAAVIERIETEIAALEGPPVFDPVDTARAGAVISIAHDGTPRIERGFVQPQDEPLCKKPAHAKPNGALGLSEKLMVELTAFKTVALRHALGEHPDAALTAVTHALALSAFFRGAADYCCLELTGRASNLAALLPAIEEAAPAQAVAARHAALAQGMPQDPGRLWEHLAAQTAEDRLAVLAHCLAFTVDAIERPQPREERKLHADQLARAVGLDLAAQWKPTAQNYLGRVSKERILDAMREAISTEAATNLASLPKAAMAEAAEARLAATRWLPEILRTARGETGEGNASAPHPKRPAQRQSQSRVRHAAR